MEKQELNSLIKRYLAGKATDQDYLLLDSWYLSLYRDQPMEVSDSDRINDLDEVQFNINREISKVKYKLWPRITAVAAVLFTICAAGLYIYVDQHQPVKEVIPIYATDVLPGGNKALLFLSNGKKIDLAAIQNGQLATQAGTQITKTAIGKLVYTDTYNHSNTEQYNKIETPNGGSYELQLPDGTRVWLNAASTLRYPTSFTSLKERKVELSGEAYFEVAKNKAVPFRVEALNQVVEVLGTHFNITSYKDELAVRTTLLEGSVKINNKSILKPGQQAVNIDSVIYISKVDPETAMEWKNGKFSFNQGQDFKSAMRQIERWYDVKFVYPGSVAPNIEPRGRLSRKTNLSTVLDGLEEMGNVHFKIEGRRVVVTK